MRRGLVYNTAAQPTVDAAAAAAAGAVDTQAGVVTDGCC